MKVQLRSGRWLESCEDYVAEDEMEQLRDAMKLVVSEGTDFSFRTPRGVVVVQPQDVEYIELIERDAL